MNRMKPLHSLLGTLSRCAMITTLVACHESYPGLYAPVYDAENPDPEVTVDRLPVILTLTDPVYALTTSTVTRGGGAFGFWEDEDERRKWKDAVFGVYAFYTPNHAYSTQPNLAAPENQSDESLPLCLIRDRKAHITDACELQWVDYPSPYYSLNHREAKYNFFLYHVADARGADGVSDPVAVSDAQRVVMDLTIDGTQDLIAAHARPNTTDVERLEETDEVKYLMNHSGDLVYSTAAARLQIDPHFRVNHLQSKLEVYVQAAEPVGGRVRIESVGVIMPYQGRFTVASQWGGISTHWNDTENVPATGVTWNTELVDTFYVPVTSTPTTFGATRNRALAMRDPLLVVNNPDDGEFAFSTRNLLVPAVSKLGFVIYYRYFSDDPQDAAINGSTYKINYQVQNLPNGGLKPGMSHHITLRVYGPTHIELEVDGSSLAWKDGGDIEIEGGDGD